MGARLQLHALPAVWRDVELLSQGSYEKLVSLPATNLTDVYLWQDRAIAFHRCKECGCMTHMAAADIGKVFGVNARMMPALDPAEVTVIQMDNSHTGWFWTKSDRPIRPPSPHMPMPTAEDWRYFRASRRVLQTM